MNSLKLINLKDQNSYFLKKKIGNYTNCLETKMKLTKILCITKINK